MVEYHVSTRDAALSASPAEARERTRRINYPCHWGGHRASSTRKSGADGIGSPTSDTTTMATAAARKNKRVLADATNARTNIAASSPGSAKKRKLEAPSTPANGYRADYGGPPGKIGSSQPKSQFEEEVLEKLTQDINGLKERGSEKDQQWARPPLDGFDESRSDLCFQQIEAEEGTIHGGKTAVKLFGVTEVTLAMHAPGRETDR